MALTNFHGNPRRIKEMLESFIHKPDATENTASSKSEEAKRSENAQTSCNPTNKELFLERVKTFSATTWAAKPNELSPMNCARYGWTNTDNDQLKCVTCNASLFSCFPDDWDSEYYKDLCHNLVLKLRTGHEKLCPWQDSPCPTSFLNFPHHSKEHWMQFLRESFSGLLMLGRELPLLNEDSLEEMGLAERGIIQELLSIVNHEKNTDEQNLFARTAVALALCGWKASDEIKEDDSIFCDLCGKECGLWNYVRVIEEVTPTKAKRHLHGKEGDALDAKRIYASFLSDVSTFRSSEFISSNASMHSEADSQVSENGAAVALDASDVANRMATNSQGSGASGGHMKQDVSFDLTSEESNEPIDENKTSKAIESSQLTFKDLKSSSHVFTEPLAPFVGKMELMKALLLATAPNEHEVPGGYSESVISEVGSEAFEKRLEASKDELTNDEISNQEPDPPPPPPANQENLMKELLFVTAPKEGSPKGSASIFSEVGSLMFDKRLETCSVCSPRSETPNFKERIASSGEEGLNRSNTLEGRVKRMRFHEPSRQTFDIAEEHHRWCPWIVEPQETPNTPSENVKAAPGWKTVLFSLVNNGNKGDKQTQGSPEEVWKAVRKFLKDCQSPTSTK